MKRRVLNILTALSLLVAAAGAAVWGRSYAVADSVSIQRGTRAINLFSDGGSYVIITFLQRADDGSSWAWEAEVTGVDPATAGRRLLHFEWTRHTSLQDWRSPVYVAAPQWTVPALFGALPAIRISRWRRRRRAAGPGFPLRPDAEAPARG